MKIKYFILLICNITLCYAALPINVVSYGFKLLQVQNFVRFQKDNHVNLNNLKEDQSIIYLDSDQNQWVYSRLNQNGDIILSIKLKGFMGKSSLNDEYMIEPDKSNHRYLYIFSYFQGQYQQIDYELLLQTQNNQEFDCKNDIKSYGDRNTRYLKRDSLYLKGGNLKISQISKMFSPEDQLTQQVIRFQKTPYYFYYQESTSQINYFFWKGSKYQINTYTRYLVVDYENDIVLTDARILGKFSFEKDVIEFKQQIQLKNGLDKIALTEIYTVNQVKLIGINDDSLKFYDLNTFQQVSLSSNSDQIGQIDYFNELFLHKNLIFVKTDVYKMSYDQASNEVILKKLKSLNKKLNLTQKTADDAIWATPFTQGQTKMLQVDGQNQIISMERIICQDGQFLTPNSDCLQCKTDEVFQIDKCVSCPQGSKKLNITDNICIPCDQPTAQKSCECQNYNYQNSSQKCIQCQSGQQFNKTKDSCDQICDDGSFFNGSTCQKCTKNCIKCSNDKTCDQCDETNGYFLDANKQNCFKCDQNLNQILNNQKNGCDCQKGYFLDTDSQCKKCKKGCDDCDKNKCNQCVAGYYKIISALLQLNLDPLSKMIKQ
ncbi:transmembrane protein, putative (macronuclear) [Tetrahymena thermophila SB210]|uniref:Transmembrane protein, putative n=1 Tax=Tetrahymena thermophila (strain SB210) TaxID=312017 RepID=W7XD15_TETTS|nr:transmembrane protein, putative [Tetrahymena thermophila SB210]EWS75372.1 transmembrane protein, putative [Tetrahymena thermophila SB210]|eukprot:XP_012652046.1 transmembrane protein, putative [Tetrahymena thermophila SB210]